MNENEKENSFSETVENKISDGVQYDIFSENVNENTPEVQNMNRDYLHQLYGGDMSFLNKEVRMTRMQYLREIDELDTYYKAEKKKFILYFIGVSVVFVILLGIGIWALTSWYVYWKLYQSATADFHMGEGTFSATDLRGIWVMAGVYGTLGVFFSLLGILQFCFFGLGYYKKLKSLKRYRARALNSLEERKKEAMLLGHYDSLK